MTTQQDGFDFLKTRYTSPAAPFQKTSDTSVQAAEAIEPHRETQEYRVLQAYRRAGEAGRTMAQVEIELGIGIPSVCARTNKLEARGLIVKTTRERETHRGGKGAVYVAKEFA
jgi:hypothetical protein